MPGERVSSFAKTFWRRLRARLLPVIVEHHPQFVVAEESDGCENPIFVIGTHRSGTTLVRRVLDSHEHIACPPESHFLVHFFRLVQDQKALIGLEEMGFSKECALAQLRAQCTRFHEIYRRSKGKPRWADKTPEYALHLDGLYELFGRHSQLLFVIRHPLDVAFSLWKCRWQIGSVATGDPLVDAARHVAECGWAQIEFLERHGDECHVLFYDDLMGSPEQALREVCQYLHEPWSEQLLRHSELPHDVGHEDPIARVTQGFRASAGNWKAWSRDDLKTVLHIVEPLMERLGYTADKIDRAARGSVLSRSRAA